MNKKKLLKSILILPIPPIFLALCFWWSSISFVQEEWVKILILVGFVLGIIIDFLIYKKYLELELSKATLLLAYFFYSICVFGFFMGVPVFNIFVCIPFAIYIAKYKTEWLKFFSIFSSAMVFAICCASAYIAINDEYTVANLDGMFNLHGTLNMNTVYMVIIAGGLGLIVLNYLLARYSEKVLMKITKRS